MELVKKFPTLYTASPSGTREWNVSVFDENGIGIIEVKHGLSLGATQKAQTIIRQGKNLGKRNETTPVSQALKEAESKWNEKSKIAFESLGELDKGQPKYIAPMLAKKYRDANKHVVFPCAVQPKLDGVRCVASPEIQESLWKEIKYTSRTGKEFEALHGLDDDLLRIGLGEESLDVSLDGEIYTADIAFEEICSAVRRNKETNTLKEKLQYWIYDIVDTSNGFGERSLKLQKLFKRIGTFDPIKQAYVIGRLVCCPTYVVQSHEDIIEYHKKFVEAGYEGTIIRNLNGGYTMRKRSNNLQKLKDFVTDEFKILKVIDGVGKNEGTAIFICEAKNGKSFSVTPEGSHEIRREYYLNRDHLIGKMLTVRYQTLTRYGKPKFANGLAIRDYE